MTRADGGFRWTNFDGISDRETEKMEDKENGLRLSSMDLHRGGRKASMRSSPLSSTELLLMVLVAMAMSSFLKMLPRYRLSWHGACLTALARAGLLVSSIQTTVLLLSKSQSKWLCASICTTMV